jgi:hypothetical protein
MATSTYLVNILLGRYIDQNRHTKKGKNYNIEPTEPFNNYMQLSDCSKHRLIDQIISEAIVHFTTFTWAKKEQKVAGDILHNLSAENGRGNLYETLIQDSRRR